MPLFVQPDNETPEQKLAREGRERLGELKSSLHLVYGNLMNYEYNNSVGVTPAQYLKAWGADAKEYKSVMRGVRRLLLLLNPDLKSELDSMVPKKSKKTK